MKRCSDARLLALLRETLSPDESTVILEHLERCPNCRQRLQLMGALQSLSNEPSRTSGTKRARLLLAAAVLLLMIIPTLILYGPPASSEIPQASAYPHFPVEVRSQEAEIVRQQARAMQAYRKADYQRACEWFDRIPTASRTDTDHFFHGVSLYLTEDYREAIRSLEQVRSTRLLRPARWYLAHSLLQMNRRDGALTHLEYLSTTHGEFQESATRLLDRFRSAR